MRRLQTAANEAQNVRAPANRGPKLGKLGPIYTSETNYQYITITQHGGWPKIYSRYVHHPAEPLTREGSEAPRHIVSDDSLFPRESVYSTIAGITSPSVS